MHIDECKTPNRQYKVHGKILKKEEILVIKFGTDGWRAVLGKEFNRENVARVTLAAGKYVAETFGYDKLFLIGYDPRNMADEYAAYCASLLKDKGFNVKLSNRIIPTPVLAYNAKYLNAEAIMFTASHNPSEYLGMKFIPDYAGPATSEITDRILLNLDEDYQARTGSLEETDFFPAYYEHIKKLVDFNKIKRIKSRIIFDGLYSASIGYFDKILKDNGIHFESIRMYHNSDFGGGMPDPKPQYLQELINRVKNTPGSIGLANDGDADRFGVINEKGDYVSPNVIISLLLKHLVNKGYTGAVAKTTGSSLLIDRVAEKLGIKVIETPVGFKYIGEAMRKNDVIIGGEESGGLSIKGHIPEKDGILANLLVLELLAETGKSLFELENDIHRLAGCRFYTDRIDLRKNNSEEIKYLLEKFSGLQALGCDEVSCKDLKDGVKLMFGENTKILVRPSGTEPLLRVYFESDTEDKIKILEEEINKLILNFSYRSGQN